MSQTHYAYPQLTSPQPWQIRDDGDDSDSKSEGAEETLLELTDRITERLSRAEALAWVLQSAEQPPEHAPRVTAMVLLDLIQEARQANEQVWERIRRMTRQDD